MTGITAEALDEKVYHAKPTGKLLGHLFLKYFLLILIIYLYAFLRYGVDSLLKMFTNITIAFSIMAVVATAYDFYTARFVTITLGDTLIQLQDRILDDLITIRKQEIKAVKIGYSGNLIIITDKGRLKLHDTGFRKIDWKVISNTLTSWDPDHQDYEDDEDTL